MTRRRQASEVKTRTTKRKKEKESANILLVGRCIVARSDRSRVRRTVAVGGGIAGRPLAGQSLANALGGTSWRDTVTTMAHRFRRKIAFVKALGAVLARGATVFVDTFRLAFATAHAGAAGSEGRRAHSRHGG